MTRYSKKCSRACKRFSLLSLRCLKGIDLWCTSAIREVIHLSMYFLMPVVNQSINQSINQALLKQYHFNNIALPVGRIKILTQDHIDSIEKKIVTLLLLITYYNNTTY